MPVMGIVHGPPEVPSAGNPLEHGRSKSRVWTIFRCSGPAAKSMLEALIRSAGSGRDLESRLLCQERSGKDRISSNSQPWAPMFARVCGGYLGPAIDDPAIDIQWRAPPRHTQPSPTVVMVVQTHQRECGMDLNGVGSSCGRALWLDSARCRRWHSRLEDHQAGSAAEKGDDPSHKVHLAERAALQASKRTGS